MTSQTFYSLDRLRTPFRLPSRSLGNLPSRFYPLEFSQLDCAVVKSRSQETPQFTRGPRSVNSGRGSGMTSGITEARQRNGTSASTHFFVCWRGMAAIYLSTYKSCQCTEHIFLTGITLIVLWYFYSSIARQLERHRL